MSNKSDKLSESASRSDGAAPRGEGNMTQLNTDTTLLKRLATAAARPVTERELHEQRVSFIMGSFGDKSDVTREQVSSVLARHDGVTQN